MADNTNPWKWMVAILAILNILLIITIWRKPMNGPQHRGPGGDGGPAKMIIEELKLSQAQIQQFEKLKEEHHSSVVQLRDKGRLFRDNLFELLRQDKPDENLAAQLADSISLNQKQIEMVTFTHFKEVRQLCDEDQKKRFDNIIGEVTRMMSGPPRGKGPPPR